MCSVWGVLHTKDSGTLLKTELLMYAGLIHCLCIPPLQSPTFPSPKWDFFSGGKDKHLPVSVFPGIFPTLLRKTAALSTPKKKEEEKKMYSSAPRNTLMLFAPFIFIIAYFCYIMDGHSGCFSPAVCRNFGLNVELWPRFH